MKERFTEQVKTVIEDFSLISRGDSVLVAVSGGADSVCLLHVLNDLKDEYALSLSVAHVNHMLRGKESDRDAAFVKSLCAQYNLPLYSCDVNVQRITKEQKMTLEEAGRKARYDFFLSLKEKHRIDKIATAHNKDDNAETVCMRFMRGTGIKGLCGIPIKDSRGIIRPLLYISRAEIELYLSQHACSYVTDSSNDSDDYARNMVRHHFIPYILSNHNPGFVDTLCDNLESYTEAENYLAQSTNKLYQKIAKPTEYGIKLSILKLRAEDKCLIKRIIIKAIVSVCNEPVSNKTIQRIYKAIFCDKNQTIPINSKLVAHIAYDTLCFVKQQPNQSFSITLSEGINAIPNTNDTIFVSRGTEKIDYSDKNCVYLKGNLQTENFRVRTRRNGDRIFLGNCGHKKVKDVLMDEKIPSFLRDGIPLLFYENELIWICGIRDNPKYRHKSDENYIKITYTKETDRNASGHSKDIVSAK